MARDINSLTQRYDSETDPTADPDTDATGDSLEQSLSQVAVASPASNKMQHSLHGSGGGIGPRSSQQHSSFKRPSPAPVMGNRGLETRQSKRSQQGLPTPPSPAPAHPHPGNNNNGSAHPITVGALEVMNVKRVVNRYGTLPKVQRIGAYLDSLEDSSEPVAPAVPAAAPVAPPPANGHATPPSARINPKVSPIPPQQMIRSNSSGGVTMQNNAAASLNKLQRHRTTTEGTMMTFSSFRAAGSSSSPKRSGSGVASAGPGAQPALANLEFPPPPLDLPPPPEEFEGGAPPPPPPAAESAVQAIQQHLHAQLHSNNGNINGNANATANPNGNGNNNNDSSHNDVSNTAPSVEEASSRFGVSLRKREPSTDSCSSLGSPPEDLKEKLITEIKAAGKESAAAPLANGSGSGSVAAVDPVSLLVTELAESMNLPKQQQQQQKLTNGNGQTGGFKPQLKKVDTKKMSPPTAKAEPASNIIDFKAHLRRVDKEKEPPAPAPAPASAQSPSVANNANNTLNRMDDNNKKYAQAMQKTEIKIDVTNSNVTETETTATAAGEGDLGKRRSTGSINSLKKLWEQQPPAPDYASSSILQQQPVNGGGGTTSAQLSPKYGMMKATTGTGTGTGKPGNGNRPPPAAPPPPPPNCTTSSIATTITTTTTASSTSSSSRQQAGISTTTAIKTSHSTQLFTDDEHLEQSPHEGPSSGPSSGAADMTQSLYEHKPQIQQKPAVPHKPTKLTIYATPIGKLAEPASSGSTATSSTQISRESILELVGLLEGSLKHPVNAIAGSQWLQLSDKLNILQNSCVIFAENGAMPPHSKFQFRELVTRVEAQSQHLRSAGSKNVQDNERLVAEVGQSLRQISNALNR